MRFAERTVIVTGGSLGLGAAMVKSFAGEGARVAVIGTNQQRTAASAQQVVRAGGVARPYLVDISDAARVARVFDEIVHDLGPISVLVNNAAISAGPIFSLMKADAATLRRLLGVNVFGPLHCSRQAARSMKLNGGGAIINISSQAARMPSGAYGMTKAAVDNLTLTLANELGPDRIRVNGVAPGRIEASSSNRETPENLRRAVVRAQLVDRVGGEDDIARAVLFLASDEASFITGQTLLVDGGFLAQAPKVIQAMYGAAARKGSEHAL